MDNPEYTFQILEVFSKMKTKEIPRELEEYISYVARTGDPVFQWSMVKVLIKEKLLLVLEEFMDGNPNNIEIPPCPNVDPFNFETMKNNLLGRLDSFLLPPFTIQRLCELLSAPFNEYNRLDKYMRAVEKNVLVVSSGDLSSKRVMDADSSDAVINGILYEKVDDSLNNASNHVFSGEDTDAELSSKLDETDEVQQMIEESWTDDNHGEFKLNGGPSSSALGVNFENELQFVTDKTCEEKIANNTSTKDDSEPSFDSNSMLLDSSLQNIIGESSNIAFENISKQSEESFESKNDDTYEFKSDSICESEPSSTTETEVEETLNSKDEITPQLGNDGDNVSSTIEEVNLDTKAETIDAGEKLESNSEYLNTEEKADEEAVEHHEGAVEHHEGAIEHHEGAIEHHQLDATKETNSEYVPNVDCENESTTLTLAGVVENNELADVPNIVDENVDVGVINTSELPFLIDHENVTHEAKADDSCAMEVDQAELESSAGDGGPIQDTSEAVQHEMGVVEMQTEQTEPSNTE